MKKIVCIIFVTLIAFFFGLNVPAYTKSSTTINGCAFLNKEKYESLRINGALTFNDLFIKNFIIINGSIQGKNLKCKTIESNGSVVINGLEAKNIEINGSFSAENIHVTGNSELNGETEIKNGKLHNIKITSTKFTIIDSQISGNICVKKVNRKSSVQIFELKGNSIVKGDVVFEEEGELHLFDQAKVEGRIINAKVIQK